MQTVRHDDHCNVLRTRLYDSTAFTLIEMGRALDVWSGRRADVVRCTFVLQTTRDGCCLE